jgi:hypothetical protein
MKYCNRKAFIKKLRQRPLEPGILLRLQSSFLVAKPQNRDNNLEPLRFDSGAPPSKLEIPATDQTLKVLNYCLYSVVLPREMRTVIVVIYPALTVFGEASL